MFKSRRTFLYLFVGVVVLAFLARTVWFYPGFNLVYRAPTVPESAVEPIESLTTKYTALAESAAAHRTVLIDTGHNNGVDQEELTLFTSRLTTAGAAVEFVDAADLAERLHEASALIVIAPSSNFAPEEGLAIRQFVDKGGRLILFGDPTRMFDTDAINSLASQYDVIYLQDYIYNLEQNDGGFRNVILTKFAEENPITAELDSVVFETAHSLRVAPDAGIIMGDDNTFSSSNEEPGGVIAAALTGDGKVLSMPDSTFLTSPFNSFADNDRLIDNIVLFAVSAERSYTLDDFPYYFGDSTDIVYADPSLLNDSFADFVTLRNRMTEANRPAVLAKSLDKDAATIYLASYSDADSSIETLLDVEGVSLDSGEITIKGITTLDTNGTVLFHLVRPKASGSSGSSNATEEPPKAPPYKLIILADDTDDFSLAIEMLIGGGLSDCIIRPQTAVCQIDQLTGETGGGTDVPDNGGFGGGGFFLVVADDYQTGSLDSTSAVQISDALKSSGSDATIWSTLDQGTPSASTMLSYQAVFWSSGIYAPDTTGIEAIISYLDGGGQLFIEGSSIGYNWSGTDFLAQYLKAEYIDFGTQCDAEVALSSHPLALGLPDSMSFESCDVLSDVVQPLDGAETVLVRGSKSELAGEPALIAYQEGSRRVAFSTFPLSQLSQGDLSQLVANAASWFTSP